MRHTGALIGDYRRGVIRRSLCMLAVFAACALPALAQDDSHLTGDAWYRQQLIDLAEVLGGSHYLRIVCEGRGDQRWRTYMQGVIQREPELNNDLIGAFNRGYREQETRFPACDETTRQMEAELRARGLRISQALGAHNQER
jgi:uncharacterized protein (TIGR02301 family)